MLYFRTMIHYGLGGSDKTSIFEISLLSWLLLYFEQKRQMGYNPSFSIGFPHLPLILFNHALTTYSLMMASSQRPGDVLSENTQ